MESRDFHATYHEPGAIDAKTNYIAVYGESRDNDGVQGRSHNQDHSGVAGINDAGGIGVYGNGNRAGVWGESQNSNGVVGFSHHPVNAAVSAVNLASGLGLWAETKGGATAGHFQGNVTIDGDLTMLNGKDIRLADFSEDFDISGEEALDPGTVVVLDPAGSVQKSQTAYDKKVAGVISGAGDFRPAITLDRQTSQGNRIPIALMGKVYCKVDAHYSAVEVGDLLTTSPTPGHAMKAEDPLKAFGSIIGKALRSLHAGCGLIPILVALQ